MLKKSAVALALFAALFCTSHAFAGTADLVITSAALNGTPALYTFDVVVENHGTVASPATSVQVRMIGTASERLLIAPSGSYPCYTILPGKSRVLHIPVPGAMLPLLQMWRSQLVYFDATCDFQNAVSETENAAGEINNTANFSFLPIQ